MEEIVLKEFDHFAAINAAYESGDPAAITAAWDGLSFKIPDGQYKQELAAYIEGLIRPRKITLLVWKAQHVYECLGIHLSAMLAWWEGYIAAEKAKRARWAAEPATVGDVTFTEDMLKATLKRAIELHETKHNGVLAMRLSYEEAATMACEENGIPKSMVFLVERMMRHSWADTQAWANGE